jgi:hypothetical protein
MAAAEESDDGSDGGEGVAWMRQELRTFQVGAPAGAGLPLGTGDRRDTDVYLARVTPIPPFMKDDDQIDDPAHQDREGGGLGWTRAEMHAHGVGADLAAPDLVGLSGVHHLLTRPKIEENAMYTNLRYAQGTRVWWFFGKMSHFAVLSKNHREVVVIRATEMLYMKKGTFVNNQNLVTLQLPRLQRVDGPLRFERNPKLTVLRLPSFEFSNFYGSEELLGITVSENATLTRFELDNMGHLSSGLLVLGNPALEMVGLPKLRSFRTALTFVNNGALLEINCPLLVEATGGPFHVIGNPPTETGHEAAMIPRDHDGDVLPVDSPPCQLRSIRLPNLVGLWRLLIDAQCFLTTMAVPRLMTIHTFMRLVDLWMIGTMNFPSLLQVGDPAAAESGIFVGYSGKIPARYPSIKPLQANYPALVMVAGTISLHDDVGAMTYSVFPVLRQVQGISLAAGVKDVDRLNHIWAATENGGILTNGSGRLPPTYDRGTARPITRASPGFFPVLEMLETLTLTRMTLGAATASFPMLHTVTGDVYLTPLWRNVYPLQEISENELHSLPAGIRYIGGHITVYLPWEPQSQLAELAMITMHNALCERNITVRKGVRFVSATDPTNRLAVCVLHKEDTTCVKHDADRHARVLEMARDEADMPPPEDHEPPGEGGEDEDEAMEP